MTFIKLTSYIQFHSVLKLLNYFIKSENIYRKLHDIIGKHNSSFESIIKRIPESIQRSGSVRDE